jgi:hypothetical protein
VKGRPFVNLLIDLAHIYALNKKAYGLMGLEDLVLPKYLDSALFCHRQSSFLQDYIHVSLSKALPFA